MPPAKKGAQGIEFLQEANAERRLARPAGATDIEREGALEFEIVSHT